MLKRGRMVNTQDCRMSKGRLKQEWGSWLEGSEITYLDSQYHIGRYVFASQFVVGKYVLDIACGVGYGSSYLAKKGASRVIGYDKSLEAISNATKYYGGGKTEFISGDAAMLPFVDNSFNCVVSLETIEHIKEYKKFLSECKRVLKGDGSFICSTPNRNATSPILNKPLSWCHTQEFCLEELHQLLLDYFGEVQVFGQDYFSSMTKIVWQLRGTAKGMLNLIPKGGTFAEWMSKIIFRQQHQLVRFSVGEMDTVLLREGKILPYNDGLIPQNLVMVAKK